MPKEYFVPDAAEPHLHVHKNGVTYTDVGHSHRDLQAGDQMRKGVIKEVLEDLRRDGRERQLQMVQWIEQNLDY